MTDAAARLPLAARALSERVLSVPPSGIRRFFDIAATMEDVISLGVGEPDFATPAQVIEAGIASLRAGRTHYTSNYGTIELRRAIASHLERPTFNVSVLGLSPADADALATSEITTRASRRARLTRAAAAERAFYLHAGPPPWLDALAWTDPGASATYAAAESLRDTLDTSLGASYPTRRLAP